MSINRTVAVSYINLSQLMVFLLDVVTVNGRIWMVQKTTAPTKADMWSVT